jgi:hypothetical protein
VEGGHTRVLPIGADSGLRHQGGDGGYADPVTFLARDVVVGTVAFQGRSVLRVAAVQDVGCRDLEAVRSLDQLGNLRPVVPLRLLGEVDAPASILPRAGGDAVSGCLPDMSRAVSGLAIA